MPSTRPAAAAAALLLATALAAVGAAPAHAAVPANDHFADAAAFAGFTPTLTVDSRDATTQSGEPRQLGGDRYLTRTTWLAWTPPASGTVLVATNSGSADTGLNVYTGTSLKKLTRVAWNDDANFPYGGGATPDQPTTRAVIPSLTVVKGTTYYLQVGSAVTGSGTAGTGDALLTVTVVPSRWVIPNDDLASATKVKLPASGLFGQTTPLLGGSIEAFEPSEPAAGGDPLTSSVWYTYTLPSAAELTFTSCGRDPAEVAAYQVTAAGAVDLLFSDPDSAVCPALVQSGGEVFERGDRGTTMLFRVAARDAMSADVSLVVDFLEPWIAKISPASGPQTGGTTVTITGQAFLSDGTPTVTFGTKAAKVVGTPTMTKIVVKVPKAAKKGAVKVVVRSGSDSSNVGSYRYR